MKTTLKRKLIVGETVGREGHVIGNALSRFRRMVYDGGRTTDRIDWLCLIVYSTCRNSRQCASTAVGTG